jgi:YD repeat-containing protein
MLYIDNDHSLQVIGLMDESDHSYLNAATVEATLLAGSETGSEVDGEVWPLTLGYLDPSPDTVGGDAVTPTTVKSISGWDITVTVGGTTALALTSGRLVRVLHADHVWRLVRDAAGAITEDVVLHLEPVVWPDDEDEPLAVQATRGEIFEIVDGTYSAVMDKAVAIQDEGEYFAKITSDEGGLDGAWYVPVSAGYRS